MTVISTFPAYIPFCSHLYFKMIHCFHSHLRSIKNDLKLQQMYYTRDNLHFGLCLLSNILNEHNISETSSFILFEYGTTDEVQKFNNPRSTHANWNKNTGNGHSNCTRNLHFNACLSFNSRDRRGYLTWLLPEVRSRLHSIFGRLAVGPQLRSGNWQGSHILLLQGALFRVLTIQL
jgi:hypothetical protein